MVKLHVTLLAPFLVARSKQVWGAFRDSEFHSVITQLIQHRKSITMADFKQLEFGFVWLSPHKGIPLCRPPGGSAEIGQFIGVAEGENAKLSEIRIKDNEHQLPKP